MLQSLLRRPVVYCTNKGSVRRKQLGPRGFQNMVLLDEPYTSFYMLWESATGAKERQMVGFKFSAYLSLDPPD